jgi:hypothetical protein
MRTLRITITIGCILLSVVCVAQRRQIGDARTILKSGKNLDKAEKLMTDLLKDSANLENPRIYDVWLEAVEKQYGQLNEQMYKKEEVDTAKLFNLTKRMFTIAERLDSLDMLPDKKGKVNLQYRKANSEKLMTYRPNLFFGGAYYVRKSDFDKAFDLFETYIDCSQQPLFEAQDLMNTDARMGEAAYWASYSGYRMNDPVKTLRYLELARRDTAKLESTLLYAAEAWRMLKDETQYQTMLWEGFRLNPHSSYFFPRLIDSYTARGNYEQGLAVANEALKSDSLNQLFLFAKSTMQLNLGQYAECLKTSEQLINMNCEMADAYYNAGTACLNIVLKMDSRMHKKQIKRMYQRALPYMEAYRRLAPQEKDRWAPALYRIYFNLNMGKQFDEIDKLLQNR